MIGRAIAEICRELAESARLDQHHILAQILRMAALEAATTDARHEDRDSSIRDLLVGAWDWDIANDRIYADARFAQMFSISADKAAEGMPLQVWLDSIHPDDVAGVTGDIRNALTKGATFSREYRVISDGSTRWVYARGKCTLDQAGNAVRFPGAIVDITQEKLEDDEFSIAPS